MTKRLSHEFRTPITVVRSSLDNLAMLQHDKESLVYMERAQEGVNRLSTILTNMSEATRLEHTLRASEKETFNLLEVVSGCLQGYRMAYPDYNFQSQLTDQPLHIFGVPENIAQLLDKVVANAVEFSEPKSDIHLSINKDMGQAHIKIINFGTTLSEEMHDKLFDSMVTVRKESDRSESHLGLGLYIARLIVEFHQGRITIENLKENDGVVVAIWLPLLAIEH